MHHVGVHIAPQRQITLRSQRSKRDGHQQRIGQYQSEKTQPAGMAPVAEQTDIGSGADCQKITERSGLISPCSIMALRL